MFKGLHRRWMTAEMRIGSQWPRPEQAAVGALDRVPVGRWPSLAAHWLAAGFDSEPLRELAQLRPRAAGAGQERMFDALRTSQAALVLMPQALGGDPMTVDWDGEDRVMLLEEMAWWRCGRAGHALAPVGQLTAEVAKTLRAEE